MILECLRLATIRALQMAKQKKGMASMPCGIALLCMI
jgi:hypothetical protein